MISVSNGWKNNLYKTLLPELFVELSYEITEPGLQEEAIVSANYPEAFSNVDQIVSRVDKDSEKYAALDYGCWGLDGTFSYMDGSPVDPGYIDKNYSDGDGELKVTPYPKITIDFEKRHNATIPGITITWSETFSGWATDFKVSAYDENDLVASTTVNGNTSIVSDVLLDMVNYTRIEIEILKWSHPFHRVRCTDILLGIGAVFTKTDLLSFEHHQSVDLLSASLPESYIQFKLRNDDGRWNPDSPTGTAQYLLEQQQIHVRYGMEVDGVVEWIKGGMFWLSEWNTPTNGLEVSFTARDTIDFMVGEYSGSRVGTLYDIAVEAFEEANLSALDSGKDRFVVDESLKKLSTDFTDDGSVYTIAEVLQMVAHAGCCVLYQDRDGVVHIRPRNKAYSNYMIEPTISYSHPEYEISKPLKTIQVEYDTDGKSVEIPVANRGEIQTISNPLVVDMDGAMRVGQNAKEILQNRRVITGDFRADLRMDALDNVIVTSKYASNVLCITDLTYSISGGAFKGTYTGRVATINLDPVKVYSNEIRLGEVW